MNRIIIIKDYIYEDNYIIGYPYEEADDSYILEDGDIYTIDALKSEGHNVLIVEPKEIIEKFKGGFE